MLLSDPAAATGRHAAEPHRLAGLLALAAIAGPSIYAPDAPPLGTIRTDCLGLLAWCLWLAHLMPRLGQLEVPRIHWRDSGLVSICLILGLLLAGMAASVLVAGFPAAIALRHGFALIGAGLAFIAGVRLSAALTTHAGSHFARAVVTAFAFAGLCGAVLAVLQYLGIPGWWQPLRADGRAGGNLGQPNLLGTQLLWAFAALVVLRAWSSLRRGPTLAAAALLILALAMTASRTAAISCLVLTLWGWLDRRLDREVRLLLLAAPVALAVAWAGLDAWHLYGGPSFSGAGRLQKDMAVSARLDVWRQSLALITQHPWLGSGWGQFNFAWTLTPMPDVPRSIGHSFTHAHNLFLQWAVELGLPLAIGLTALLMFALGRRVLRMQRAGGEVPVVQRAAMAMVLVVLLHSQLEFPLWSSYFLLPSAMLLGMALAPAAAVGGVPRQDRPTWVATFVLFAPLLLSAGAAFTLWDYRAIAEVYRPSPEAPPQEQRIGAARQSLLFGYLGDRLAGTLAPAGSHRLENYRGAVFEVLDERLLASWALAHAEHREVDKARFLAQRLKEFDSPMAQAFFAVCAQHPDRFQCTPNQRPYSADDFRAELQALPRR